MISLTLLFFFFQKELYQKKTETSLIFLPQTRLGFRNILPLSKRGNELLCRPTPVTHRSLGAARSILAQPPSAAVLSQACASSTAPGLQANERFIARWVRHTYALRPLGDRRSSSESSQSKIKARQMLIFLNIVPVLHCISCSAASRQNPGPTGLWGVDPLQKGSFTKRIMATGDNPTAGVMSSLLVSHLSCPNVPSYFLWHSSITRAQPQACQALARGVM